MWRVQCDVCGRSQESAIDYNGSVCTFDMGGCNGTLRRVDAEPIPDPPPEVQSPIAIQMWRERYQQSLAAQRADLELRKQAAAARPAPPNPREGTWRCTKAGCGEEMTTPPGAPGVVHAVLRPGATHEWRWCDRRMARRMALPDGWYHAHPTVGGRHWCPAERVDSKPAAEPGDMWRCDECSRLCRRPGAEKPRGCSPCLLGCRGTLFPGVKLPEDPDPVAEDDPPMSAWDAHVPCRECAACRSDMAKAEAHDRAESEAVRLRAENAQLRHRLKVAEGAHRQLCGAFGFSRQADWDMVVRFAAALFENAAKRGDDDVERDKLRAEVAALRSQDKRAVVRVDSGWGDDD